MAGERLRRTFSEPNLVPLIDVALILVIIFMVLTPIIVQSQLTVKLPKAETGTPAEAQTTVNVQIARTGQLSIEGRPVKREPLQAELTLRLAKSAQKTLLVQSDRSVPV